METVYKSRDGQIFDDAKVCAKYELETFPEMLEILNQNLEGVHPSFKARWCESGACCCVGCINRQFYDSGLTKSHWELWKEEYANLIEIIDPYDDVYGVLLNNVDANNRPAVMKVLRQHCGYGVTQVGETLKNLPSPITYGIYYNDAKKLQDLLINCGATAFVFKDTPDKILEDQQERKTIKIKFKN